MKAEERKIVNVFSESIKFCIPDYQRPYSWEEKQALQLFEDIYESYESSAQEYFIGSLILIKGKNEEYEVVDGQQRLTTLTILFSSIMNRLEDAGQKEHVKKKIMHFNPMTKEAGDCRLIVRPTDSRIYKDVIINGESIVGVELSEPQEKMIANKSVFDSKLNEMSIQDVVKFEQYLENNVQIVWVHTDNFPSAFRLFNVLNARGLPLSNSDLIKNYLLSKVKNDIERQDVTSQWEEIEEKIGVSKLDEYFGHLRTSICGNKQVKSLQDEFIQIVDLYKGSAKDFAKDLLKSSIMYLKIQDGDFSDPQSKLCYKSLSRVYYNEWIPALLCYLRSTDKKISETQFLKLLERITYQNWIRGLGRTKRNQVYYDVISEINKNTSQEELLNKFLKHENDKELEIYLNGDVYGRPYAKALLLKIEDILQDDSVSKEYHGYITIEHVLPQSSKDDYWTTRFTDEQKRTWVHKIGNLTLISGKKNSAAQNYDFSKKKKIYLEKDKKVSFDMTKEVCKNDEWNLEIIESRQKEYTGILCNEFQLK